jgi:glycosyltransferase involved in cell wall biosynthesis
MERKGGWQLLDLWRRRLRHKCRLVLVTPADVPAEPGVEVVRHLAPGDDAIFGVLAGAAALAFPSRMDTFGYAPIEAMAVGVPVVAFRAGATPEVVRDGCTGVLVPPNDHEAFGDALELLLDDDAGRRAMGRHGRGWVETRFDARATTRSLVTTIEEAVDAARAGAL